MKKALLILLCFAMLIGVVSCNRENDIDLKNGENIISDTSLNTTENKLISDESQTQSNEQDNDNDNDNDNEEILKVVEKYKEVLIDFMNGIVPETVYWPDLSINSSLSFAIVDMNGDGLSEVVVEYFGENAVLHYVSEYELIRAITYDYKNFYNIRKDGTFAWNRTSNFGHEYGAGKLIFYSTYVTSIELYTIRNDGTENTEFFIFDRPVTIDELDAFHAQLSQEPLEYYDLTKENVEKYITVENFIYR